MLFRNRDGSIKKAGRIEHVLDADFITGARPSWCSIVGTSTTESFIAASTGRPAIQVASAASSGADAGIKGPDFLLSSLEMLEVAAHGVSFSADDVNLTLGAFATNDGARLYQGSAVNGQASASVFPAASDAFGYNWRSGGQATHVHDLAIRIYPRTQMLYVFAGKRTIYAQHRSGMGVAGVVTPQVSLRTSSAASRWIRVERFTITAEYR